ncbi:5-formyltetrahydrofolate cyclo-ligase [Pelotalea chapellei]|uniref:5-formyltetrahydrofolate cyclo-ligase n=1 Tax=Pelotalea chapellei TaxID=44671 RepID=A0ABS5U547_9BACT|nr:5-formyltetrahydrofolate cyclo-ligase [Pelotalea chapellei]MBT1070790.1 5-formyltetrahydrofolate cyclo-ligase [Pelotalea chapellei]
MPKRTLRQQVLARRKSLSQEEWRASSDLAQLNFLSLEEFTGAECVALYSPAHHEPDTTMILGAAIAAGKKVLYPVVCGNHMVLRQVEGATCLTRGCFGILEPCSGPDHQADEADLIVVPGVVFDLNGHRIGYGKGFYDRFLQHPGRHAHLVGLCYDFQVMDEMSLPVDQHDIQMEVLVTDKRIIHCGSNRRH